MESGGEKAEGGEGLIIIVNGTVFDEIIPTVLIYHQKNSLKENWTLKYLSYLKEHLK